MHDLKGSLSLILFELNDIEETLNEHPSSKNQMSKLHNIEKTVKFISENIKSNQLMYSLGSVDEKFELLDINQILNDVINFFEPLRRKENIELTTTISTQQNIMVSVKHALICNLCLNILINAIEALRYFKKQKKIMIETKISDVKVSIIFKNNGPIIENPQKIFSPFYSTKPKTSNSGLGLYICQKIIEFHNGQISCYNENDVTPCFLIKLPSQNI